MEDNKYYIPELEEFHIGFEYEWKCESTRTPWTKSIMTNENGPIKDGDAWRINDYRIKYLDKEDIESFGFEEQSKNYYFKDAPGSLGYWTDILLDIRWGLNKIAIKGFRGDLTENEYLFQGTIKNKSELKKILKQIGICQ